MIDKYLIVGNNRIELQRVDRRSLKGVWLDSVAKYSFWKGRVNDEDWLMVVAEG